MGYIIKAVTKEDIPDIRTLYKEVYPDRPHLVKTEEEIEWLFSDPRADQEMLGFLARTEEGILAGLIGYSLNKYCYQDRIMTGVIPISWMISAQHRGILGIQLLKKVMVLADFGFAIQGSSTAQQAYRAVKLKPAGEASVYTKVLRPLNYFRSERKSTIGTAVKSLYFYGKKSNFSSTDSIGVLNYQPEDLTHAESDGILRMVIDNARVKWIQSCPLVESLTFNLEISGKAFGPAICYIRNEAGIMRGRIVHLPYMGGNLDHIRAAISLLERELYSRTCCVVSVLAFNPVLRKALEISAYKTRKSTSRALYVRDPRGVFEGIQLSDWHLSFYESDKGYRGI